MSPTTITLIFLAFAVVMFVTEKIPLAVTSMSVYRISHHRRAECK